MSVLVRLVLCVGLSFTGFSLAAPQSYTVQSGDTLSEIVQSHRVSLSEVITLNRFGTTNPTLKIGQKLLLPEGKAQNINPTTPPPSSKNALSRVRSTAYGYLGIRYRYGSTIPSNGLDCSGFTRNVMSQMGIQLPRTSQQQYGVGSPVSRGNLREGDLVFFGNSVRSIWHVGIYLGDGQFINANSYRGRVMVDNLGDSYWRNIYVGARRVI